MEDVIFLRYTIQKILGTGTGFHDPGQFPRDPPNTIQRSNSHQKAFQVRDSEYLINNSQVRLKDVNELFMDTGIGKEGYSIIGQGKIDAAYYPENLKREVEVLLRKLRV